MLGDMVWPFAVMLPPPGVDTVSGNAVWVKTAVTRLSEPELHSEVPIIYWVIDPAPVRAEHIRLFELWQIKNGHCTEHRIMNVAELDAFRRRKWSPVIATAIREGNEKGKNRAASKHSEAKISPNSAPHSANGEQTKAKTTVINFGTDTWPFQIRANIATRRLLQYQPKNNTTQHK